MELGLQLFRAIESSLQVTEVICREKIEYVCWLYENNFKLFLGHLSLSDIELQIKTLFEGRLSLCLSSLYSFQCFF